MATIIRKDNPQVAQAGLDARPISFSFADIRGQASDYLENVRQEAAKIVQQAHRDAERLRKHAEAAGRKAAEAAIERVLEEKVAKRVEALLPALERVVAQMDDAKGEILSRWEEAALQVATAIAERIIHRELRHQPDIALDTIRDALRLAAGAADITLRVNPDDYRTLQSHIDQLAAALCRLAPSQIVADANITTGGCRVETRFGVIDHQIETQLRRIEQELG
jgi:flagellar assembly protein FliH